MAHRVPAAGALAAIAVASLAGCAAGKGVAGPPPPTEGAGAPGAMVRLPGGTFRAGEPTGPRHDVVTYHRVRPFLLDVTEVTVAAYGACVAAGRCRPAETVQWDAITEADRASYSQYCNRQRADRADHPVNCVDWRQAAAYCAWAGKRLPSEEEWEWAARNGKDGTPYPWGSAPPGERACWKGEGSDTAGVRAGTCPAGSHPAGDGAAGLKDLAGNVWEWTSGDAVVYADGRGRGGVPVKVAHGGGWSDVDPHQLTASVRLLDLPSTRRSDLGFRCAKSQ
jgi:formylglycine-generating enzyme required for sulfatase activity